MENSFMVDTVYPVPTAGKTASSASAGRVMTRDEEAALALTVLSLPGNKLNAYLDWYVQVLNRNTPIKPKTSLGKTSLTCPCGPYTPRRWANGGKVKRYKVSSVRKRSGPFTLFPQDGPSQFTEFLTPKTNTPLLSDVSQPTTHSYYITSDTRLPPIHWFPAYNPPSLNEYGRLHFTPNDGRCCSLRADGGGFQWTVQNAANGRDAQTPGSGGRHPPTASPALPSQTLVGNDC